MKKTDLTPLCDDQKVLANPHKGWYHHYFDNAINKYPSPDADIEAVAGLDHLYLRLAWAFLEPGDGRYNWPLIDDVINRWTAKGYGIAFRITCKETDADQKFATPQWVKEAGAQGTIVRTWGSENWRPDYGDPIFLEYLERFHRAFAARYNGQKWLRYVDVGSYGQWGEGHHWPDEEGGVDVDIIKAHIELHRRCYTRSPLVISDSVVEHAPETRVAELTDFILQSGVWLRDDSIGVKYHAEIYPDSVQSPALFERAYRRTPTVLELEHYGSMKASGVWRGPNGSESGGAMFEGALRKLHATYIGYHGWAKDWLDENPDLTRRLANRCGYWYFPQGAAWPDAVKRGQAFDFSLTMLNRGVAPAYHRYRAVLRLRGDESYRRELTEFDNRQWLPDVAILATASFPIPTEMPTGQYDVEIGIFDGEKPVQLALRDECATGDGFYRLGEIAVTS